MFVVTGANGEGMRGGGGAHLPVDPRDVTVVQVAMARRHSAEHRLEVVVLKEPLVRRKEAQHLDRIIEHFFLGQDVRLLPAQRREGVDEARLDGGGGGAEEGVSRWDVCAGGTCRDAPAARGRESCASQTCPCL